MLLTRYCNFVYLFELCFSVQVVEAKKLYVELDKEKKSFGLEHCWKILKGEDKWKAKMIELAELEKEKQAAKKKRRLPPRKRGRGRKKKFMLNKPHQRKGQKG
jgi:predicted GNAT family N-acyltransferase